MDNEWRTSLWRRWVVSHLVPEGNGATAPAPSASVAEVSAPIIPPAPTVTESTLPFNGTTDASAVACDPAESAARIAPPAKRPVTSVGPSALERRADVRARFDALSERLQGLEDAIDVIARRLSHRSRRERRTDRRTAELVESIAEHVEAHALAVDDLRTTLERIERRIERIERPGVRDEAERRDSRVPKARNSEPPRSAVPPRPEDAVEFDDEESAISGASIRGSIGDMSLSTVLAMLEIERRSGRLKVQGDDGSIIAFELEEGSVVGSRLSENDVDAVESLREVLTWKNGRFWFRQNPSESQISPPRSVNSLLLEATRQIDEAVRAG